MWPKTGTELYYLDAERRMNAARIETTPSLRVVSREVLFTLAPDYVGRAVGDGGDDVYDVSADGQRFLMAKLLGAAVAADERGVPSLVLLTNWLEYLEGLDGN